MAQHSGAEIRESRIQSQDRLQRKILSQREKREAGKMAQWVKTLASKSDSMSPYNSSERTWGPVTSFLTSKWACGVCTTSQIHYAWNRCEKNNEIWIHKDSRDARPHAEERHTYSHRENQGEGEICECPDLRLWALAMAALTGWHHHYTGARASVSGEEWLGLVPEDRTRGILFS